MLKKTITYEDYNGETVSEDFYFNLSKAELIELAMLSGDGDLVDSLERVAKSNNMKLILDTFKRIIMMAYGEKSADGKRFIKNDEVRETFASSEAYSALFMELALNAGAAADFVNGIVPKDLAETMADLPGATTDAELPEEDDRPAWIKEDRAPTHKELATMSKEQLQEAFQRKTANAE